MTSLITSLIRYHKMCLWLASTINGGTGHVDALISGDALTGAWVHGLMTTDEL